MCFRGYRQRKRRTSSRSPTSSYSRHRRSPPSPGSRPRSRYSRSNSPPTPPHAKAKYTKISQSTVQYATTLGAELNKRKKARAAKEKLLEARQKQPPEPSSPPSRGSTQPSTPTPVAISVIKQESDRTFNNSPRKFPRTPPSPPPKDEEEEEEEEQVASQVIVEQHEQPPVKIETIKQEIPDSHMVKHEVLRQPPEPAEPPPPEVPTVVVPPVVQLPAGLDARLLQHPNLAERSLEVNHRDQQRTATSSGKSVVSGMHRASTLPQLPLPPMGPEDELDSDTPVERSPSR